MVTRMRRPAAITMWTASGLVVGVSLATATPEPTHVAAGSSAGIVTPTSVTAAPTASSVMVNGAAYATRYGPVKVQISVRSRRITAANAIEYPSQAGRDQEINSYAVPQLDKESLDAQSAQIDTVSGATYTSDGYRQSLQSAIDAATKAGAL